MSNAAARALLRQGLARSQVGRTYDVARASILNTRPTCELSTPPTTTAESSPYLLQGTRAFHASPTSHKKKKEETQKAGRGKTAEKPAKGAKNSSSGDVDADDGPKHPQPDPEEPLDFADVESRLQKHSEHFKASLKKMHTGGRFDPDIIGLLPVTVDKKTGESYQLWELAMVVPRGGRTVSLLVHESIYVKPIMSAVQASPDYNQQPQRDPENELELILKIEPEKPEDLVKRIKAVAHEWRERIRAVRQKRSKQHVTWGKEGLVLADVRKTADKELEKIIKAAVSEVDEAEKSTLKLAESK